ncbi:gamma-glutamyltransferase family protein [uncultured Paraglaciecola sp.]|uniref:gamma-glutamyltransferase family protein n=1 Tax=uncultured Paraglaciecola sp. TaxID=1765024 RepID=UPI0026310E96|nr:gamma-glutamyltransferase family protein [uncultured Paraglaciecola sp.]
MRRNRFLCLFIFTSLFACSNQKNSTEEKSSQVMVVTANPLATEAGLEILRAGGSAVDAAVAIEAVLSLVEPQSSGLAGGGFMVHFDASENAISVFDGRETAPSAATKDMFLDANNQPMGFLNAKNSGLSTGVPGMVAMLSLAHQDQGLLQWPVLFDRATQLATDGFHISPRLHGMVQRFGKYIPDTPEKGPTDAHEYFFDDQGQPHPAGYLLKNPAYAKTLKIISADPTAFYTGSIAQQIAEMVQRTPRAGRLTAQDIAAYQALKHPALCQTYKTMQVCGAPPSSSWVAVGMILGILENSHGFSDKGATDPNNWALFAQAQQLAYADRDQYVADTRQVDVPLQGLLHPDYLAQRASLITKDKVLSSIGAGDPWKYNPTTTAQVNGKDATQDVHGTTHFVIVDAQGDVVSMTATVESIFGTTRMVGGMFLNNQLTDFSFRHTDANGLPIANAVASNKKPRSSMSPSIVLDNKGQFLMATGSPGGNNIIAYTAKTLIGVFDWGLSPQQAVDLPNLVARGKKVRLEKGAAPQSLVKALQDVGLDVDASRGENSGLSVILRKPDGSLEGAADKRREGVIGTL